MDATASQRYYLELVAAYVRGAVRPRRALTAVQLLAHGRDVGLRLHRFKRTQPPPRVQRVLGALRGLRPQSLLDLGSGRGVFLWPLIVEFPQLPVLAVERDADRASQLQAVHRGGVGRLRVVRGDGRRLPLAAASVDVVTVLEVLEHLRSPEAAMCEALRICRRFVVVSVPSHADDNPQHLHVLDERRLRAGFVAAGARRVRCSYVLNHLIALVSR